VSIRKIAFATTTVVAVGMFASCLANLNRASAECISLRLANRLGLPYLPYKLADKTAEGWSNDFPTDLRTDLKGSTITIALPENAPDVRWDDELIAKFHELTGIQVKIVRPGNDTTAVLSRYLADFQSGDPMADVYAIDVVWPAILSGFAEDLRPAFGDLRGIAPGLIGNDTVSGKMVAIPYFAEVSLLYYRTDLLRRYHFAEPPRTWSELEQQARVIEVGERSGGDRQFWGYLWQGAASEALTCNAYEWQLSQGGGSLLTPDGALNVKSEQTAKAWDRARRWIGTISPPEVTDQLEDDSLQLWTHGRSAFMRNWPYAWRESMRGDSKVEGRVGVTVLPRGEGPGGRHADVLGGFQLMVSNRSTHKEAAIELVRYLTSPQVQRLNAIQRGYLPTRLELYDDPVVLRANPFFGSLKGVLLNGAVARPSNVAGRRYDAVSRAYFTAAHQTLTGEKSASRAVEGLNEDLLRVLAK